ncbi:rod shape-determining protein MreC [Ruminococcaceae bacterium OttesenSCG-928-L11]|nr:rod shape-determining protein MreC [Ruminococcaceae bacterium OttesenSCG-928-L11]
MKDFLKSVRFKILVAILTVLLGFMIMAVYTGGSASLFAQLITLVTVPIQRVSANISYSVSEFFDQFVDAKYIHEENEVLKAEVNELRRIVADYERIKHENEQFRQIIGVMENRQDLTTEIAAVIARDAADRFYSFTIDKGSFNGVKRLDPVMTADGLVGYVTEVGFTYAKVITVLDVEMDVGAYDSTRTPGVNIYDSSTRDIGIISGTIELAASGLCQMEYLPRESSISAGDIIMTSGGSMFPKDILVGTVQQVKPNSHGTSLVAIIKPAADIVNVKNVFVITHFEGQGET